MNKRLPCPSSHALTRQARQAGKTRRLGRAGAMITALAFNGLLLLAPVAQAADVVKNTSIGMDLARDIASAAIEACRADGYHVSAVVVDRFGLTRAALRDDLASRFTLEISERKANMTVMAWTDSGEFLAARGDIRPELNHIDGLIVMDGGVKIVAGGFNIGAIGISGAPGGDLDAACARKGIEALEERIEFALDD